jgi:hypothetical protein
MTLQKAGDGLTGCSGGQRTRAVDAGLPSPRHEACGVPEINARDVGLAARTEFWSRSDGLILAVGPTHGGCFVRMPPSRSNG